MSLISVPIHPSDIGRLGEIVGEERAQRMRTVAAATSRSLSGRSVINVNSTGKGGGVAEMLIWLLGYVRGAGIDAHWYVVNGSPLFFSVTKRLHNMLHGYPGDGQGLTEHDMEEYRSVLEGNAADLRSSVSKGDVVILHDPQTAGLVPAMKAVGATVIWRCHVGTETRNDITDDAWNFISGYIGEADAIIFSRDEFVPEAIDRRKLLIVPPSIDPFATKNRPMSDSRARAILAHTGILRRNGDGDSTEFVRADDSTDRVNRMADIIQTGPSPEPDLQTVVQVSRWDRLKDMQGLMEAFAEHVDGDRTSRLVLAGPVVTGVADDPEGGKVLTECTERWRELPHFERSRIQLVCLPMVDIEENAAIVNALQTHATLVVQKSLEEGFGLTVTEAMWKGRPVVASAVGGIQDQIVHGESGLLISDPSSHKETGSAIQSVLDDDSLASKLGSGARERVKDRFLGDRHLSQYAELLGRIAETG